VLGFFACITFEAWNAIYTTLSRNVFVMQCNMNNIIYTRTHTHTRAHAHAHTYIYTHTGTS